MSSLERREWLVAIAIGIAVTPLGALVGRLFSDKGVPLRFSLGLWGFAILFVAGPLLVLAVIASLFRGERRRYPPTRKAFWFLAGIELLLQLWGQAHAFALLPEGGRAVHGMFVINPLLAHLAACALALIAFFIFHAREPKGLTAPAPDPGGGGRSPG